MTEIKECSRCRSLENHEETRRMDKFAVLLIVCNRCGHSKTKDIREIAQTPTIKIDIPYFDRQVDVF